jgi:hypothetical protein
MVLLIVLLPLLALGALAWLAGADSRDGFADPCVRPSGRTFR